MLPADTPLAECWETVDPAGFPKMFVSGYVAAAMKEDCMLKIKRFEAAKHIQSWYRMVWIRRGFLKQKESALVAQRIYRGVLSRREALRIYDEKTKELRMKEYIRCATLIERVAKGYIVRSTILDAAKRRAYVIATVQKGQEVAEQARIYGMREQARLEAEKEEKAEKRMIKDASQLHHLLSTSSHPSVLSPIFPRIPQPVDRNGLSAEEFIRIHSTPKYKR